MSSSPPLVLTFAASDPTGGAGLQADLLTLASMGCHPLSVVTALTVQDTAGVDDVLAIDADRILDPVIASGRGDQLADEEMIDALAQLLFPQTSVLTPNSLEARRLALDEDDEADRPTLAECARRLRS